MLVALFAMCGATRPAVGAAGDIVVTLDITASGNAAIGTGISDACELQFHGSAVFPLDPKTGRYGDATQEQYTMIASGNGHVLDIESWTYSPRQPGAGTLSLNYLPSEGRAVVGWPYMDDFVQSAPESGGGSDRMARTFIKMAEDNLIMKPGAGEVRFQPKAESFEAFGDSRGEYSNGLGGGTMTATYSVKRTGEELEAVILEPQGYPAWIPNAGPDAATPGTNPVVVAVELRLKGSDAPPPVRRARFRFELIGTSQEPGLCLNRPKKEEAKDDFDLQFGKSKGITPTAKNQVYETEDFTTTSSAIVLCYDYGAFGRVRVTAIPDVGDEIVAHLDGKPDVKWLTLPQDENDNRIADAWEKSEGTYGEIKDPAWDEADLPDDHRMNGDGIGLYEKYRGFFFGGEHERLMARRKHVFLYDPDGLVHLNLGSVMSFQAASLLRVRFITEDAWTGSGTAGASKRIVNFNTSGHGHAVDQHALHVRLVNSKVPTLPQDYQDMWKDKFGVPPVQDISRYYGMTFPDVTGGNWGDGPCSVFAIELYPWGIERISASYVWYHTWGLPQFKDFDDATKDDKKRMQAEIQKLADEYIRDHPDDFEEQNILYLLAGTSHETGHGVGIDDLVPPNNGGPITCYMRYMDWDFPYDVNDRMELKARWHNDATRPQEFCHDPTATTKGKGCYEQIRVTDRKSAGKALQEHRSLVPIPRDQLFATGSPRKALASVPAPVNLRLGAALEWEAPLAGDPLRFTVRLDSPAVLDGWTRALSRGETNQASSSFPVLATQWPDGLQIELVRLEAGGGRTVVVPKGPWSAFRREVPANPEPWERRLGWWTREFLTDPASVPLAVGEYVLSVAWDGRGRVDPDILPASGMIHGTDLTFTVRAPEDDAQRAGHLRRLAFLAWDREDWAQARTLGREALGLAPADAGREAHDTAFVVAIASLRLGRLLESAETLRDFGTSVVGRKSPEMGLVARSWMDAVSPTVRFAEGFLPGRAGNLRVYGHAGQTYEVQASPDLLKWETVDRRLATEVPYDLTDPAVAAGVRARFYRVVWWP